MDVPNQSRKVHPRAIPRIGGIAIWLSIVFTVIITQIPFSWKWWTGISILFLVGLLDDLFDFSVWLKIGLQFFAALFMWYFVLKTLFPLGLASNWFCFLWSVLWIIFVTNIINYMDNSHGLCAGTVLIMFAGLGYLNKGVFENQPSLSFYLFVIGGALLGFLFVNFPRGHVFLGDAGSHLLGALIALSTLPLFFASFSSHSILVPITPMLILAVPILDFIQVSVRRLLKDQSLWKGDTHHFSHLLVRHGFSPVSSVLILWLCTAVCVWIAIVI